MASSDVISVPDAKARGIAAFRAGDMQAAEEAFDLALNACAVGGDRSGEAEMRVNLAVVHIQTGRLEQAEQELLRAQGAFAQLGSRSEEAQVLGNLGALYERAGNRERATACYRQAIEIFDELGERENKQATLGALTKLQVSEKQWLQSLFTYDRMLANGSRLTVKQRVFRWLFRLMSRFMKL